MYHDQVLTPIKAIHGFEAINITLGLPFLRISPDHGPNEKMIAKNKSNFKSLLFAFNFLSKLSESNCQKSLGQNFLVDENIIKKIVKCAIIKNKNVLEIGPGTGNLTKEIIKNEPKKIFLIEKDNNLIEILKSQLKYDIKFINDDILKIDENNLSNDTLTVFGNLPYNISTKILTNWILNINEKVWFDKLILMFQKEVADRIIANHNEKNMGDYLSCALKLDVKKIIDIQPNCFRPMPKVQSSLLEFKPKEIHEI